MEIENGIENINKDVVEEMIRVCRLKRKKLKLTQK